MDGGNSFQKAVSLGTTNLSKRTYFNFEAADAITSGESADWFKFRIGGRAAKNASMLLASAGVGGITTEFYRASTGKKQTLGKSIAKFDETSMSKTVSVVPGTYFVKVSTASGTASTSDRKVYAVDVSLFDSSSGGYGGGFDLFS